MFILPALRYEGEHGEGFRFNRFEDFQGVMDRRIPTEPLG
jgi:hypothetical protein